jgi:hypothetical protein
MRVADFNALAGTITVRLSKAGKPRHVVLAAEGKALFDQLTAGLALSDYLRMLGGSTLHWQGSSL